MTVARGGGKARAPLSRRDVVGALVVLPLLAPASAPGPDRPDRTDRPGRVVIRDGWILLESDLA